MDTRPTKKFDISGRLDEQRDGKFHFNRKSKVPRKSPRSLLSTVIWMFILLMILMFLKRLL